MKIMVVGIGGVGGYLGSVLCSQYEKDVTLVARKARGASLREKGLVLHSAYFGEKVFHPQVVETPAEAGPQDVIFVCVKNYSLEAALESLKPILQPSTIVVLVMNGVDHDEVAAKILPETRMVSAVIYVVSGFEPDFSIKQQGQYARILIGSEDKIAEETVYTLLHHEGFNCIQAEDIKLEEWKKYIRNCAFNVITAYYQGTIGKALAQPEGEKQLRTLLEECNKVARALGYNIPSDMLERECESLITRVDPESTSSLARDVIAKRPNELETFSGYLVKTAHALGIEVPLTEKMYAALQKVSVK